MTFIVKPNRLNIQVKVDEGKSVSLPGKWGSNFFVDEKEISNRKDYKDKFYVDYSKELFWENGINQKKLNKSDLKICVKAIQAEADKKGWQVVWPPDK